jgi:hypothetical protein
VATEPDHAALTAPRRIRATARARCVAAWVLALVVAGCRADSADAPSAASQSGVSSDAVQARIVEPTAESRAELQATVAAALHGADVTLAADALVHSSLLIVGPKLVRDAQNNPIMGRELDKPTQFVLWRVGDTCELELRNTGEHWTLSHTQCVAE